MILNFIIFMKRIILLILLSLILTSIVLAQGVENKKKILVVILPGGKSHHFIFKDLLHYVKNKENRYEFHIVVHNIDNSIWTGTDFFIHSYGNLTHYEKLIKSALESAKNQNLYGIIELVEPSIDFYRSIVSDKVVEKLKNHMFDVILGDLPNHSIKYLKKQLNIKKTIYMSPMCIPSVFFENYELNPSYTTLYGSSYSDKMSFFERFFNLLHYYSMKIVVFIVNIKSSLTLSEISTRMAVKNSVFLSQCIDGVTFPVPLPRNADNIGAVLPKPAQEITNPIISNFLLKFERVIYISQGTLVDILDIEELKEVFINFKDIGFILSLKKEIIENTEFPSNSIALEWVPQNDLLGHPKVHGFINHAGINSIYESIYHSKPMIVIGACIDQVNYASLVKNRNIGIGFTSTNDVNKDVLIYSINEILNNNEFKTNLLKFSKIMKSQNPHEKFKEWLDKVVDHGYDHLIVEAYKSKTFFQLYNIDVAIFIFILVWSIAKLISTLKSKI